MLFFFKATEQITNKKKKITFCQQKINKDINQRLRISIILFYFYINIF